jgi:hypothetical protein
MICSDLKLDSHRFKDIIDEAIAEGRHLVAAAIYFCLSAQFMHVYESFHFDIWCKVTHYLFLLQVS